jgi:hypothetical protein
VSGGGLFNQGTATLTDCTVSGNSASNSGGGLVDQGTLTLTGCTVSGNVATNNGGGLNCNIPTSGILTLTDCTVSGNSAGASGGGLNDVFGTITLTNCTVSANSATTGGGLHANGVANLTNTIVAGNTASTAPDVASGTVTSATISSFGSGYTSAPTVTISGGGGTGATGHATFNYDYDDLISITIDNGGSGYTSPPTITLSGGGGTGAAAIANIGVIISLGNNLIGKTDGGPAVWGGTDLTGTAAAPLDPKLAPLADNGGPTQTMALSADSPAVNAGTAVGAPSTDQRGYSRVGNVDIGAYEFGGTATQSQTITFGPLAAETYGDADFAIGATTTSGLPVVFTASGNATVYEDTGTSVWYARITGAGSATITAHQAGNVSYSPAPDVAETLAIDKATASITVTPYSVAYDGNPHTATGTATGVESPLPANLSGLLDLSGTTHTNPGTYSDTWTFEGNLNYASGSRTIVDMIAQPPPAVTSIATVSPNPRNAVVSSINVTFTEPINTSSLTSGALVLTDDGSINLINSGVSIMLVSGTTSTYTIGGLGNLTAAQGLYTLVVNAADIQNQNGIAGVNSLGTSWLMDTTAPSSHVVNSLAWAQSSDTFSVPVTFTDPRGAGGSPASGVTSLELFVSVNNGPFSLSQTMSLSSPEASGIVRFTFVGQDRNTYAFHGIALDAAGNTESKSPRAIEASTSVPDLHPPVTHVLAASPSYSWGSFPSSEFSGLAASSYSGGVFTINWAGADPDQNTGRPAGSIKLVDIYVAVDGSTTHTLIGQASGISPGSNGIYSGSLTYKALADGLSHTYAFYSVGIDDQRKAQPAPTVPDVTFSEIYTAPLAANLVVEKGIAERSFIQYLDVDFNQTVSANAELQSLQSGLTGASKNAYVELLWYGENLGSGAPKGSVNLFDTGTTAALSLSGNDLSINFGANGITSLLTEAGVSGTGKPTTNFGDGWFALGIDPSGNPSEHEAMWLTFFRLFGSATGDETVSGPYTTAGTDAALAYGAISQTGPLLNADVDGSGSVNSKDLSYTVVAKGAAVGATAPSTFPQFQLFAGGQTGTGPAVAALPAPATLITQKQVQALLPSAIDAWQTAGLDAADVRTLESVQTSVGNLGTSILGLEAGGELTINQTAAGYNWYVNAASASSQASAALGDEPMAAPGTAAASEVDLLTVLEHELGHVIGLADNTQAGDLMDITLGLGVRRAPTSEDVAAIVSTSSTLPPARAVHLAEPAFVQQRAAFASVLPVAVVNVSVPLPSVDVQRPQSSAVTGPVTRATVDAAMSAIQIGAGGNSDDRESTPVNQTPPKSAGSFTTIEVTPAARRRTTRAVLEHPRGVLSGSFTTKIRRPGQPFGYESNDSVSGKHH